MMQMLKNVEGTAQLCDWWLKKGYYYLAIESHQDSIDLFDFIEHKIKAELPERVAKEVFRKLLSIVIECSKEGVWHFDLKDENVIITMQNFKNSDEYLREFITPILGDVHSLQLIDFGSAVAKREGEYKYTEYSGTMPFTAPEHFFQDFFFGEAIKVWSLEFC